MASCVFQVTLKSARWWRSVSTNLMMQARWWCWADDADTFSFCQISCGKAASVCLDGLYGAVFHFVQVTLGDFNFCLDLSFRPNLGLEPN